MRESRYKEHFSYITRENIQMSFIICLNAKFLFLHFPVTEQINDILFILKFLNAIAIHNMYSHRTLFLIKLNVTIKG